MHILLITLEVPFDPDDIVEGRFLSGTDDGGIVIGRKLMERLGPVARVTGSTSMSFAERTITSEKKFGEKVSVEVPTHVTGTMDFVCGAVGTIVTSFDVVASETPRIEIFGTEGTISIPDPNGFGGVPKIRRSGASEWSNVPLTHAYADNSRGLGVADMAAAAASGRKARANGELACHVLDIMHAIHDSSDAGKHIMLETTCNRPAAMPMNLLAGSID